MHPPFYKAEVGGRMYTRIESITFTQDDVTLNIKIFSSLANTSIMPVKIDDPVCIQRLPALLKGELSCEDALQKLTPHFRKKHSLQLREMNNLEGISTVMDLQWDLCGIDDFVKLCQFFPRERKDTGHLVFSVPRKVVNDEIIEKIELYLDPSLKGITSRFIRSRLGLFGASDMDRLPTSLKNHLVLTGGSH